MSADEIPDFDLYKVLEVDTEASTETIEAAHRSLIRQFHPDHLPDRGDALDHTKRLNVARDWLTDPVRRSEYDRARARRSRMTSSGVGAASTPPKASPSGTTPKRSEPPKPTVEPGPKARRPAPDPASRAPTPPESQSRRGMPLLVLGGIGVAALALAILGGAGRRPTDPASAVAATPTPLTTPVQATPATPRPSATRGIATPSPTPSPAPTPAPVARLTFSGHYNAKASIPVADADCTWLTGLTDTPEILGVLLSGGKRPDWTLGVDNPNEEFASVQVDLSNEVLPWWWGKVSGQGSIKAQDGKIVLDVRLDGDPPAKAIRVRGTIVCPPPAP